MTTTDIGDTDYWRGERSQTRLAEELALPTDDVVPYEARAAVRISADAVEALLRYYRDDGIWFGPLSDAIGWDLLRLFGPEQGADIYDTCRWIVDGDEDEEASKRTWPSFARARQPSDILLIDLVDDAIHQGWKAPPETVAARKKLCDLAEIGREERDDDRKAKCDALRERMREDAKLGAPIVENNRAIKVLTVSNAATLQQQVFAPVKYIAAPYIVEGCSLLCGKPKVGKSWWALDLGLAVASGGTFLGSKVEQGDVLALCLEDNPRRMKSRITKILGPFATWPARFHYATEWPRGDEAVAAVRKWLDIHPAAKLVIVDVLAKARPLQQGKSSAYEGDYEALSGLQKLAGEKGLAVLVIHHLRKGAADSDPFDKVSGTMGLSGAADTVLIIDRDGQGVSLYARGRDIEQIESAIEFDRPSCRWRVLGDAEDVRKSDERKAISKALRDAGQPMGPTDIAAATSMAVENVRRLLFKMTRDGDVTKASRGRFLISIGSNGAMVQPIVPPPPPY